MAQHKGTGMKDQTFENEIFDILTERLIDGRLDAEITQDKAYLQAIDEVDIATRMLEELDFSEKQRVLIDRLVCAHEATVNPYIRFAYRQAYKDCISFLKAVDLLP